MQSHRVPWAFLQGQNDVLMVQKVAIIIDIITNDIDQHIAQSNNVVFYIKQ